MKILLTGAAGFIGFHAARKFLAEGHMVIGVDSLNDYYDVSLKQARSYVKSDAIEKACGRKADINIAPK